MVSLQPPQAKGPITERRRGYRRPEIAEVCMAYILNRFVRMCLLSYSKTKEKKVFALVKELKSNIATLTANTFDNYIFSQVIMEEFEI